MKKITLVLLYFFFITEAFSQQAFKPVSATLTEKGKSFTSQSFDCGNMLVQDNNSTVNIALAGDKLLLQKDKLNEDTYIAVKKNGDIELKAVAYRSSSSNKIYLVIMTTRSQQKTISVSFKP